MDDIDRRVWTSGGLVAGALYLIGVGWSYAIWGTTDKPLFFAIISVLTAFGAGVGGLMIYRLRVEALRKRRLMQAGVEVTATITDIERSGLRINNQPFWYVKYGYVFGGKCYEGASRLLSTHSVRGLRPGQRVPIRVDPLHPQGTLFLGVSKPSIDAADLPLPLAPTAVDEQRVTACAVAAQSWFVQTSLQSVIGPMVLLLIFGWFAIGASFDKGHQDLGVVALAMGLFFVPIGGGLLLGAIRRELRYRRLLRDGKTAAGIVISVSRHGSRSPVWRVLYRFRDASGQEHRATSRYEGQSVAPRWELGGIGCTIRYDPRQPQESILIASFD